SRATPMRICANGERQARTVEIERCHAAAGRPDAIKHLHRSAEQRRVDGQGIRFAVEPEEAADDEPEPYPRAARVHAPATIERDRTLRNALVFFARLISILECRVG